MLADNMDVLSKIATHLKEKETITGKEFMEIFHEVKGEASAVTEAPVGEVTTAADGGQNNG